MKSVEKIASNADENPVQSTTSTKISHTWLHPLEMNIPASRPRPDGMTPPRGGGATIAR